MKTKGLAIFVATIFIVLALGLTPLMGKTIEWRMQSIFGAQDTSTTIQAQGIVDALNKRLEGKLHIKLFLPGQIVPGDTMFDALAQGVYDAAVYAPRFECAEGNIAFGLPFGWENGEQALEFYYKYGFLEWYRNVLAEQNIFFACPLPYGPTSLMGNFAFRKVEDMKGKKVWSGGSTASFVKHAGGTGVMFPPPEMYMGLKLGTIDAAIFGQGELEAMKLKEVVKYVNFPGVIDPFCLDFIINMKSWKALPSEVQQTIEATLGDLIPKLYGKCMVTNKKGVEAANAAGVTMVTMEPSEVKRLRTISKKVWEEIGAKSPRTAEGIKLLKDFLASKGIEIE